MEKAAKLQYKSCKPIDEGKNPEMVESEFLSVRSREARGSQPHKIPKEPRERSAPIQESKAEFHRAFAQKLPNDKAIELPKFVCFFLQLLQREKS